MQKQQCLFQRLVRRLFYNLNKLRSSSNTSNRLIMNEFKKMNKYNVNELLGSSNNFLEFHCQILICSVLILLWIKLK